MWLTVEAKHVNTDVEKTAATTTTTISPAAAVASIGLLRQIANAVLAAVV